MRDTLNYPRQNSRSWFDRCLDWMFEAYVRATTRPEVKDYLCRYPELDRALVKMIVKVRTRISCEIDLDAEMVNFGTGGEYLRVTVRPFPDGRGITGEIRSIWREEAGGLRPSQGWIALIAGGRVAAVRPPARRWPRPLRRVETAGVGVN